MKCLQTIRLIYKDICLAQSILISAQNILVVHEQKNYLNRIIGRNV